MVSSPGCPAVVAITGSGTRPDAHRKPRFLPRKRPVENSGHNIVTLTGQYPLFPLPYRHIPVWTDHRSEGSGSVEPGQPQPAKAASLMCAIAAGIERDLGTRVHSNEHALDFLHKTRSNPGRQAGCHVGGLDVRPTPCRFALDDVFAGFWARSGKTFTSWLFMKANIGKRKRAGLLKRKTAP